MRKNWLTSAMIFFILVASEKIYAADLKELKLMTSLSIAPYVIKDENRGIAIDIITEALALKGYKTSFEFVSNKRSQMELNAKRIDGAFNIPPGAITDIFISDPVVEFQNVVVCLEKRNLKIENIKDLNDKNIFAFQDATKFLGQEFEKVVENNPKYNETVNQEAQVYQLYLNRVDVIVLERRIFLYFLSHLGNRINTSAKYVIHPLFPISPRPVYFIDEKVRNDFNDGLKKLKNNGRYDEVINNYIKGDGGKKDSSN